MALTGLLPSRPIRSHTAHGSCTHFPHQGLGPGGLCDQGGLERRWLWDPGTLGAWCPAAVAGKGLTIPGSLWDGSPESARRREPGAGRFSHVLERLLPVPRPWVPISKLA